MSFSTVLPYCDHTELKQTATLKDIYKLIDDAILFSTASVCIPPCYVKEAVQYACKNIKICTVIGFPNGYMTTAAKVFETEDAIKNGADEIDMVINIGMLKSCFDNGLVCEERYRDFLAELTAVKKACRDKILKVIIETCLLNEQEKILACRAVNESGADYIKTSTGFSAAGATKEDIVLFKEHIAPHVKIKAAGGIRTLAFAEELLTVGAHRLGTSALIRLAKEERNQ